MERLTIRNSDGSVSQPTGLNWAAALERLAAYEDTGLEPCETSEKYATIMAFNRLRLKISLARLCEILQAETEGRCVVLPCMIGDTLNKCVNQAREFEELYTKLYAVTGFTAEKLLEMFAAGYVLQKPDYSKQLAEMASIFQASIAAAERVFEFLDQEPEVEIVKSEIKRPVEDIKFRHVYFSYDKKNPVINDLNLAVEKNKTVAIVGSTGAGKTTIVNLLMRFYDIDRGSIEINDKDIRDVSRKNLRSLFGMVLQDSWLFRGTIYENILYGREDATREEVIEAAKKAYCHSFIEKLPKGYDTMLNEEASNISQGQRQLLTIARALLSDPEILILDEATSSVDTRTEALIQKAMKNLLHERTNFVIAHRLSTIVNSDVILVLDKGDIVEKGNHRELLARNGVYAELYNSQFKD